MPVFSAEALQLAGGKSRGCLSNGRPFATTAKMSGKGSSGESGTSPHRPCRPTTGPAARYGHIALVYAICLTIVGVLLLGGHLECLERPFFDFLILFMRDLSEPGELAGSQTQRDIHCGTIGIAISPFPPHVM